MQKRPQRSKRRRGRPSASGARMQLHVFERRRKCTWQQHRASGAGSGTRRHARGSAVSHRQSLATSSAATRSTMQRQSLGTHRPPPTCAPRAGASPPLRKGRARRWLPSGPRASQGTWWRCGQRTGSSGRRSPAGGMTPLAAQTQCPAVQRSERGEEAVVL